VLTTDYPEGNMFWQNPLPVTIHSDQIIKTWQVVIDDKPISLERVESDPQAMNRLIIPEAAFSFLQEGMFPLVIKAENMSEKTTVLTLQVILDHTAPTLVRTIPKSSPEAIELKAGETLKLQFNERIKRFQATLNGRKWSIILAEDQKTLLIPADSPELSASATPYTIQVYDQMDLVGQISGTIRVPGKKSADTIQQVAVPVTGLNRVRFLEDAYQHSILFRSNTLTDQLMLIQRGPFRFQPGDALPGTSETFRQPVPFKKQQSFMFRQ